MTPNAIVFLLNIEYAAGQNGSTNAKLSDTQKPQALRGINRLARVLMYRTETETQRNTKIVTFQIVVPSERVPCTKLGHCDVATACISTQGKGT